MSTETPEPSRSNKEMTSIAKYLNIAVQLILLVVVAYIVTRTVNLVGIVLFTWHPVLVSIGVSSIANLIIESGFFKKISLLIVSHSHVACDLDHG